MVNPPALDICAPGGFFCPRREINVFGASRPKDAGAAQGFSPVPTIGRKIMATQVEQATKGILTDVMREVASQEGLDPAIILERFAEGQIVAPQNTNRPTRVVGIGMGLRSKVNASIGTSTDIVDI